MEERFTELKTRWPRSTIFAALELFDQTVMMPPAAAPSGGSS